MSNNGNNLHDELEKAQSKLIMVRDSCDAISYAEDFHTRREGLSFAWFEGVSQICREISKTMDTVLNVGVKPPQSGA